jgi:hypothetical protein
MIDIGVVYYRIRPTGNIIDATWYTSRLDTKETGRGVANKTDWCQATVIRY